MKTLHDQLETDEGKRYTPYKDKKGLWTVGVGRMIDKTLNGGLNPDEIELLLSNPLRNPHPTSRRYAYQDCPDFWSVPLTEDEVQYLLSNNIGENTTLCMRLYPKWAEIEPAKQDALINLMFNMGYTTMSEFHHTIAAVNAGNWTAVGEGLHASKWYAQVGVRADRIISVLVG